MAQRIEMSNDEMGSDESMGDIVSPGDVIAGKYRVDRLIGTGGMGIVVEAFHLHFEERVAIKFLVPQLATPESMARFEREARAAFKIKSEHVARVIDVGKLEGDVPYMVMEFLEGTDLGNMLTDRRAFAIDDAVELVLQALEAVAESHVLGIVHRDLKPENLFLTKRTDGTPCIKVLDFGLSKASNEAKEQRQRALTGTAQVMGTPQYMSPEQWMSARDVGPATDQWAIGVILYELVTGQQPFEQEQLAQLCTQVLRGEPEPVLKLRPDAPPGLVQIINRCLRKEPKQRFPNVGEVAVALLDFGPPRARNSVKRIVGVFRKVGVDAGEVPPSARGGGLGHNMVLGRAPASSQPSSLRGAMIADEPSHTGVPLPPPSQVGYAAPAAAAPPREPIPNSSRAPYPPPPPPSFPGLPRPAPPPRPSYPGPLPTHRSPSSNDLAATKVFHRDPGTFDHLPDPTATEPPPPLPPARSAERAPTSSRTAVLDGPFPMPPMTQAPVEGSGEWPRQASQVPPSYGVPQSLTMPTTQPFANASHTLAMEPLGDAPPQRRAVTAQSWQHMLDPSVVGQGSRERKMVIAVVAAVLMFATLVLVVLLSGGNGAAPAGEGIEDEEQHEPAPSHGDPAPNAKVDDNTASDTDGTEPKTAEAKPTASAAPATARAPLAWPPTTTKSSGGSKGSSTAKTEPKPKPSNPFDRERIFDSRN